MVRCLGLRRRIPPRSKFPFDRSLYVCLVRLLFNLRYLFQLASHQPEQACISDRQFKVSRSRLSPTSPNLPHGQARVYEGLTSSVLAHAK